MAPSEQVADARTIIRPLSVLRVLPDAESDVKSRRPEAPVHSINKPERVPGVCDGAALSGCRRGRDRCAGRARPRPGCPMTESRS